MMFENLKERIVLHLVNRVIRRLQVVAPLLDGRVSRLEGAIDAANRNISSLCMRAASYAQVADLEARVKELEKLHPKRKAYGSTK